MGNNDILTLFDVDGTLVRGARCHYQAFVHAVKKFYGMYEDISGINYAGKTDPQILREVLELGGFSERTIEKNFQNCLEYMIQYYLKNVHLENVIALDGTKKLLDILKDENVLLGLTTGNLEPIAYAKLNRVALDQYFPFGGFGSDYAERALLVKKAIKLAIAKFNFKEEKIFVIGDTPLDVAAGKKVGARTIGVATGRYNSEELLKSGADYIMDDLTDKNFFMESIGL
ncbi:MAG: HAD family hydrolase [Methanobacteriaceae archaeon]|nr:HAD family hydrolase [Methanobacteriaceae archaeon]